MPEQQELQTTVQATEGHESVLHASHFNPAIPVHLGGDPLLGSAGARSAASGGTNKGKIGEQGAQQVEAYPVPHPVAEAGGFDLGDAVSEEIKGEGIGEDGQQANDRSEEWPDLQAGAASGGDEGAVGTPVATTKPAAQEKINGLEIQDGHLARQKPRLRGSYPNPAHAGAGDGEANGVLSSNEDRQRNLDGWTVDRVVHNQADNRVSVAAKAQQDHAGAAAPYVEMPSLDSQTQ